MNSKITYFFLSGRIDRINQFDSYPEEMFYGFNYLKSNKFDINLIEAKKTKFRNFLQLNIEDKVSYHLQLPLFFSYYFSLRNIYLFIKSKHVVFTNHRVGSSLLPIIFISKLILKKPKISVFIMGLFKKSPKYKILVLFKKFLVAYLFNNSENIYFLGLEEFNFAKNNYKKFSDKFKYYPFSVDLNFWSSGNSSKKDLILFVGNDGNRDYKFLKELVSNMPNQQFIILSNHFDKKDFKMPNCQLIQGSFSKQGISDTELRELYRQSLITIIPLKDSIQPSGQSVALQSLACGTPVVISDTIGFWDKENFIHEKNIYFTKENNINNWINTLLEIKNLSKRNYENLIKNGTTLVTSKYNLEDFHEKFLKEIIEQSE